MIVCCPTSAIKHAFVNMTSEKQVFLVRSHISSRKPPMGFSDGVAHLDFGVLG